MTEQSFTQPAQDVCGMANIPIPNLVRDWAFKESYELIDPINDTLTLSQLDSFFLFRSNNRVMYFACLSGGWKCWRIEESLCKEIIVAKSLSWENSFEELSEDFDPMDTEEIAYHLNFQNDTLAFREKHKTHFLIVKAHNGKEGSHERQEIDFKRIMIKRKETDLES